MKKNNFMEGAMIATIGIVLCKILGLIYVIPFYNIIGTKGGALYSYAYSIYSVFLSLSIAGIPTAISKIVSEYDELNYVGTKEKIYDIASKLISIMGIVAFIILVLFAPNIAHIIIGDIKGGNTIEDVTIAIRMVSLALLVVPRLSILRGYFQGHKIITPTSIAEIIEQFVRVAVIIVGSYVTVKVLNLPIEYAVYVAVFGATFGAIISLIYLKIKARKFEHASQETVLAEEDKFTSKYLLKQIIFYALPFVIIDLLKSAYGIIDSLTVVRTMVDLGYDITTAETALGVMATWGTKLNMIIISISLGLTISLVPNISGSAAKKDYRDINDKTNQSLKTLLYTTLPMAFGISFLSTPVWVIFYGYNLLSIKLFQIFILQVVFFSLYTTIINLAQSMNETKIALGTLVGSFIAKALLNIPMMYLCKSIGIEAYFGPTITNGLVEFSAMMLVLIMLKIKYKFNYKETLKCLSKITVALIIMLVVLNIMNTFINISINSRISALTSIVIYSLIGIIIYIGITFKMGLINEIFGNKVFEKISSRLRSKNQN